MKEFEVWAPGFTEGVTNGSQPPMLVARAQGESFEDAVRDWFASHPDVARSLQYDPSDLSVWSGRLMSGDPSEKCGRCDEPRSQHLPTAMGLGCVEFVAFGAKVDA